ncbi:hypothetical protein BC332_08643 [Capsicum chinense]|nr:hypothetical protein BC332_08643 [Capsicum chinense]
MRRFIFSSSSKKNKNNIDSSSVDNNNDDQSELFDSLGTGKGDGGGGGSESVSSEDVVNTVDQFLHEALQNPHEHLSESRSPRLVCICDVATLAKTRSLDQTRMGSSITIILRFVSICGVSMSDANSGEYLT